MSLWSFLFSHYDQVSCLPKSRIPYIRENLVGCVINFVHTHNFAPFVDVFFSCYETDHKSFRNTCVMFLLGYSTGAVEVLWKMLKFQISETEKLKNLVHRLIHHVFFHRATDRREARGTFVKRKNNDCENS